jgi:hypothetical protein
MSKSHYAIVMKKISLLILCLLVFVSSIFPNYPDQHYILNVNNIYFMIQESENIRMSEDGKKIMLDDDALEGYFILSPDESSDLFNRGLPSWNGSGVAQKSSFKVQMRFPHGTGWSPWLTAGFWQDNIWSSYGSTSYTGGEIDYDYVKLNSYKKKWQWKIIFKRKSLNDPSPSINQLSFFVSDSRTTNDFNLSDVLNDRPQQIIIPTTHVYQYSVDSQIGGSICSPSTVSMILMSYDIEVNVLDFARATRDPYYGIFGVWPRVVQHAYEYGLEGYVTRYRNWSDAREVLAENGRIAMSIGQPLYSGHLVMLAGFTSDGRPIVHDPAKSNGYALVYNKSDISKSWFQKGGVAYTFYLPEEPTSLANEEDLITPTEFLLNQNYPNPFNPETIISFSLPEESEVKLVVYDNLGRKVKLLVSQTFSAGTHQVVFDGSSLVSGVYFYIFNNGDISITKKMTLLK